MPDSSPAPLLLPAVTLTVPAGEGCACGAYADWSCDRCHVLLCDEHLEFFPLEVFPSREFPAVSLCDTCADVEEAERADERRWLPDPDEHYEWRRIGWLR